MPQYPMPPWSDADDAPTRRRARLGVDNPRFAHLPLVKGTPFGTIEVLRGDPDLAESLLGQPASNRLFDEQVDGPHYVVRNRLGRTVVLPAERPIWVGQIEFFLYTHPYDPSDAIKEASNLDELRQALADEVDRIDRLRADGWDMYKNDGVGVQLLVDTRRPDEKLTKRDLP